VRAGLSLLAVIEAFIGTWQYVFPKSFYTDFPTVSLDPPFNEHLMSDVGGLTLAMTVITVLALVWTERRVVIAAMSGYLVFAASHFLFHLTHFDGFSRSQALAVGISLGVQVVLPIGLLIAARRLDRTARDKGTKKDPVAS
jgi:hypothetical protein